MITLDVGGTSADVALIRNGKAAVCFERAVADFPIRLSMIDIHTIGAGGGSIAWFDRDGLLKVGPVSAGAVPGPACYGKGGEEPTVSDANFLLGRLSPQLIDGSMSLDRGMAEKAFEEISGQLGFSQEKTAHGVLGIVVANMVRAIRAISVERGHDPRGYTLMPFGGAGPLHARDVAASLGIKEILVPPAPGILCAQGLVVSDLKEDMVISHRTELEDQSVPIIRDSCSDLFSRAGDWFAAESVPEAGRSLELSFDLRYIGQNFELAVPIATGQTLSLENLPSVEELKERFFQAHETAYGYYNANDPIEVVNYRLTARGTLYREPEREMEPGVTAAPQPREYRPVFFSDEDAVETAVYARDDLRPGHQILGPAIIDQLDTTTPVYPGDLARVDGAGNILIELRDE